MTACGYKPKFGDGAIHGSSTPRCGSRNPNVGFREDCFGLTPDSGRGWDPAPTGSFDPKGTIPNDGIGALAADQSDAQSKHEEHQSCAYRSSRRSEDVHCKAGCRGPGRASNRIG